MCKYILEIRDYTLGDLHFPLSRAQYYNTSLALPYSIKNRAHRIISVAVKSTYIIQAFINSCLKTSETQIVVFFQ